MNHPSDDPCQATRHGFTTCSVAWRSSHSDHPRRTPGAVCWEAADSQGNPSAVNSCEAKGGTSYKAQNFGLAMDGRKGKTRVGVMTVIDEEFAAARKALDASNRYPQS